MRKAQSFFYVSAGAFLLMLAVLIGFHLGANSATAQAGEPAVGVSAWYSTSAITEVSAYVLTPNGDLYERRYGSNPDQAPRFLGNFWSGATPTLQETWGGLKSRYAPAPAKR